MTISGVVKTMQDITRAEWIAFQWTEVTEHSDSERRFLRGGFTSPTEGAQAGRDWDMWFEDARFFYCKLKQEREDNYAWMPNL